MTRRTRRPRPFIIASALTATLVLASCSNDSPAPTPTTGTTATSTPSASTPSRPASRAPSASRSTSAGARIDITVTGKEVKPNPATVNLAVGEALTIAVTSDRDNTLHAHGFEIAKELKAGKRAEITIKGAQPGVLDFELHDPELRLFQVAVR